MSAAQKFEDFDEAKLSGEEGEIYVLQWLVNTEKILKDAPSEFFKASQGGIESTLLKIISSTAPYPPAGRPLRNLSARCFVTIYTRGETKTLFDTIQSLVRTVSDFKAHDSDSRRTAAFFCIGEIMAVFGSQTMSFMQEICTVVLKTLRSSSSSVILRYQALDAFRKAFVTAGRALSDSSMKDVIKYARNALGDKSLPIQRAAADSLVVLFPLNDGSRSISDVDTIVSACVKSLENADQETRQALARLVGHILASTQTARSLPPPDSKKKKDRDHNEEEEDVGPPAITADAIKTILSPFEMFCQLSTHFNKQNVSRKTRIGIFDFYAAALTALGPAFVELNYPVIVKHFFSEIVSHSRLSATSRYEILLIRKLVGVILRDLIGVRMLSEQGQIAAIQELSRSYLKKWPSLMPGQSEPVPSVLVIALKEVAGLVQQLGNAPPPVQEALSDPLVTLLGHQNHSTRVSAAWALRSYCFSTPLRIPKTILNVLEQLQRSMALLSAPSAPPDIAARATGQAYGLGALFAVIPERPLYVSADLSTKVLDLATQLLRRAGTHEVPIATVEVETAWIAIAALMSLGPSFVRAHLPQLLVLWRNALPKPSAKDDGGNRSSSEWIFLLHVRECALGAILAFLRHNSPALVTLDVARRLASLLSNALSFVNTFVAQVPQEQFGGTMGSGSSTQTQAASVSGNPSMFSREALLRRRIYQCFTALGFSSLTEALQMTLLQSTTTLFASPEGYAGSALQAAIATSAGTFSSLWQSADGYAYGVTTLNIPVDVDAISTGESIPGQRDRLNRDAIEAMIDDLIKTPVLGSCEHDPLLLCQSTKERVEGGWPEPPPSATAVVDAAIELFSTLLPLQDSNSTMKVILGLVEQSRSSKLERNSGRKAAVLVNAVVALALTLRVGTTLHGRHCKDTFGNSQVSTILSSFLKDALINGDPVLRTASSECIGRLTSLAGTNFMTAQVKTLVDQVVNNRDPSGRAGCALAFGSIYSHVGGLAAGPLLKTTVNVLMSLGNDPHPVVHFWALSALTQVINSASLAYAPFVSSTLGMLYKIYLMDTHDPEGGTVANANLKGNFPVYQVLCQLIDAVIAVLGPDIQESSRTRSLILDLVHEFATEPDEGICVEAIKCTQHLLMFAPDYVDVPDLVSQLRSHLASPRRPLKSASINALYQLVRRDALLISKLGGDKLVEELFGMLDRDPSVEGVRNVITGWLEQTVAYNPSAWIDLCQRIMSRTTASQQASGPAAKNTTLADDEVESLSVGLGQDAVSTIQGGPTSRWRTQLFALRCLHNICTTVARSGRREHLDIPFARSQGLHLSSLLVSRVPDLIKMAFTASAAYVTEIRLEGLAVLRDVIEVFAKSPDADYEGSLLLEQYQAPITAALTPAFSSDSTPEILSSAVHVCAVFVGSGIVKDVNKMGRILKLLTSALDQSKETGTLSLGDAGELSPNASIMLRISTLTAWAELEIASKDQHYLEAVVSPYRSTLISLWIAALRDYASIKGDSELFQDGGSATMDTPYAALGREVLLPYYEKSWSIILHATANVMLTDGPLVVAAMDGQVVTDGNAHKNGRTISTNRDEPTALFYALYGLIYEALACSSADAVSSVELRHNAVVSLQALKSLVKPEYSGKALLDRVIFDEFTNLCYRMAMTESAAVQTLLVEVLAVFCVSQKEVLGPASRNHTSFPDSPLTKCFRICAFILRNAACGTKGSKAFGNDSAADRIQLIRASFSAFSDISTVFGPTLQEEARAIAISVYADMLRDENATVDLASSTLMSLKSLLENSPKQPEARNKFGRIVHGLFSSCLLNIDEMRGREGLISTIKTTSNLLAAVLIMTSIPSDVGLSKLALEHCCFLISQKLLEGNEISLRAVNCAKTLVLAASTGNVLLRECTRLLLPGLIEYLASVAALSNDPPAQEQHISAVDEIMKAFSAFFSSVPEDFRSRVLGALLPALVLLMESSSKTSAGQSIHALAVTQVLSFASSAPAAFKEATNHMEESAREILESSVRDALGAFARSRDMNAQSSRPQIALKSF